jgi:hypothetical protein
MQSRPVLKESVRELQFPRCSSGDLEEADKFFGGQIGLSNDRAESPSIEFFVIRNDNLRKGIIASKDHVATLLTPKHKTSLLKGLRTFAS